MNDEQNKNPEVAEVNPVLVTAPKKEFNFEKKFHFRYYVLPMVINLVIYNIISYLMRMHVSNTCESLVDMKGECSTVYVDLVLLPIEVPVFIVCLIIIVVGMVRYPRSGR